MGCKGTGMDGDMMIRHKGVVEWRIREIRQGVGGIRRNQTQGNQGSKCRYSGEGQE